jgi:hypothetical protein
MIIGAHSIIYSTKPDADRAFLRDVLRLPKVDVGGGWLIFGLPPAEVAVHPAGENDVHELYLMCDDVEAFIAQMKTRGIACGPVHSMDWGILTHVMLPGGGKLGVYQPRHARPRTMKVAEPRRKPVRRAAKKPAKKATARTGKTARSRPARRRTSGR